LFYKNLLAFDEVIFQAVLIVADGEQLQTFVVLDAEIVFEASHQLLQFGFVAVEAEREHQGGGLDYVGINAQIDASGAKRKPLT